MKPESIREKIEQFITDTDLPRTLSEKCRDYYDHKQWTPEEAAVLTRRGQAPIIVNRVKPKVEGLLGLYNLRIQDPKAFPRTKKHEQTAFAITDAPR